MTTAISGGKDGLPVLADLVADLIIEAGKADRTSIPAIALVTDTVLSVLADEAWQLQEVTDYHERNNTDGTNPDGTPTPGQPLKPEWGDVARWMVALRG